jgi:sulfur carrier protein ThiS
MSTVLVMATDPVAQCLGGVNGEWVELHVSVQDGYTLECLVQCLVANYPPLGEITFSPAGMFVPTYRILVNGERIPFADWSQKALENGDRVLFRRKY